MPVPSPELEPKSGQKPTSWQVTLSDGIADTLLATAVHVLSNCDAKSVHPARVSSTVRSDVSCAEAYPIRIAITDKFFILKFL